ncbi:MAG: 50S ribosomal protein L17 [Patescibacteria group bacterium]
MRHQKKGKILDRKVGPRRALLKNLAQSVILHEKIVTTLAKAKAVKPQVEKLVTLAKNPTLANRRLLLKRLPTEMPVKKLIEVLGPRYKERTGGYLRITKLGMRVGDGGKSASLSFV